MSKQGGIEEEKGLRGVCSYCLSRCKVSEGLQVREGYLRAGESGGVFGDYAEETGR